MRERLGNVAVAVVFIAIRGPQKCAAAFIRFQAVHDVPVKDREIVVCHPYSLSFFSLALSHSRSSPPPIPFPAIIIIFIPTVALATGRLFVIALRPDRFFTAGRTCGRKALRSLVSGARLRHLTGALDARIEPLTIEAILHVVAMRVAVVVGARGQSEDGGKGKLTDHL
jgi:hypothetical protein